MRRVAQDHARGVYLVQDNQERGPYCCRVGLVATKRDNLKDVVDGEGDRLIT